MKIVKSLNNPLVTRLISLKEKNTRNSEKQFLVEGYHLVEEAMKLNLLEEVLSTDEKVLKQINAKNRYLVTDAIIKKISTTKTPQNIIGVVKIKEDNNLDLLLKKDLVKLVILDDVSDPGNLGTIIRTAAALGMDAVISSHQTVDYYNEKVIRSTQGAIFKLPLYKMDLVTFIKKLKELKITVLGTSLKSSKSIFDIGKLDKFAVIFGNEAHGVSNEVLDQTDYNIILPMDNNIESLNVSIASAIVMWELKK